MSASIAALQIPASPMVGAGGHSKDTPEKMKDAAGQFEAMLIGQMLRSVRESASGADEAQSGSASTYMEMAEQQFAQALAARGGMGLAKMVMAQLGRPHAD